MFRILIGLTLLAALNIGAEITAQASISANQVGTGESFQLTVQVTSDEKVDSLPWPTVENLEKFTVTKNMGTSRSAQTTIINGRISNRNLFITNFSYNLVSNKPGTYPIGPIRFTYKNFDKTLGNATVTVAKQEAGLATEATLTHRKAYVGEQTLYNLRIIPSQGVQQINLAQDLQKLIGEKFWFQRLDKNIEAKVVTLNGQSSRVYDVRIVLFPLLEGKAELSGIPVEYQQVSRTQRRRQGSVFDVFEDDFFGGSGSVVSLKAMASPITMEVLPLPSGMPSDFTGSVGSFSLTANIDKATLASGDAVTLTITIRGDGEPKTLTKPRLPDMAQFEVFDPEVNTTSIVQGATLITTKTFKYVMVPHRKGDYNIGSVVFPYFDPDRKVYAEAKSQPLTISVTQGKEMTATTNRVMSQREITEIGSDIRHLKISNGSLQNENEFLYHRIWFWFLFAPAPTAFAFLAFVRRRNLQIASDTKLKRKTQASAQLKIRLRETNEALKKKNAKEFYKALSQAIVGFASDKTSVEFRGLTMEEAKSKLMHYKISAETAEEYEKAIQLCDFGQFSGSQKDDKVWKEALEVAEVLLRKLDREL